MPQLTLSLYRLTLAAHTSTELPGAGQAAVLAHDGLVEIEGTRLQTGDGTSCPAGALARNCGETPATLLVFMLSDRPAAKGADASETIDVHFPCLLRLDEVAFPPGAQAYRHVHPGPGFRHLRWGALHLDADDHSFDTAPGDTWFEAAQSPVRATASIDFPETRFARCMVLSPEFQGKPTIHILSAEDADRPKRQTTLRHVDLVLNHVP